MKSAGRVRGPRLDATALFLVALSAPAVAQVTSRVSVDSTGSEADSRSGFYGISISADGRYVAFQSDATDLVAGDTNAVTDMFVRDRVTGRTERVSVDALGAQGNDLSAAPSISADGRYVAFYSPATNLVLGDTNASWDAFVHDRQTGATERVSVASGGAQANGPSGSFYDTISISADGRYVAFHSLATNLVPGDTNTFRDVFVRDRQLGTTESVSVDSNGAQANDYSEDPSISANGRFVAFWSWATNLVDGDTNSMRDIFLRDRQLGTTERISVGAGGAQGDDDSLDPSISADGRYVAFWSWATNLVDGDTNASPDVFVRDRRSGTIERISVASNGAQGNSMSTTPSISADGRYVSFTSNATNLVAGDTGGWLDVFVRDRVAGVTQRASVDSFGAQGIGVSYVAAISGDGRHVAFISAAENLVVGDANGVADAFVRDLDGGPTFTSLCDPGVDGVISCPCSNPASGNDRGCDNSSHTGGARLSASGAAILSSDSLVFATHGERPTATSIVMQGDALLAGGRVFGQGVRCVGGFLKRLYTKTAVGGSITAPDFAAGDPQVSVRSAALGDVILAGENRWYLVYYRDPNVLGGCPSGSTFNATQTGAVTWSP